MYVDIRSLLPIIVFTICILFSHEVNFVMEANDKISLIGNIDFFQKITFSMVATLFTNMRACPPNHFVSLNRENTLVDSLPLSKSTLDFYFGITDNFDNKIDNIMLPKHRDIKN